MQTLVPSRVVRISIDNVEAGLDDESGRIEIRADTVAVGRRRDSVLIF
jgi:hypothetical protein